MLRLQQVGRLLDEFVDQVGGMLSGRTSGSHWWGGTPTCWGSVSLTSAERSGPRKYDHSAVGALRLDENLHAWNLDLAQDLDELAVRLVGRAAGAPIGDLTLVADGREVEAGRQVSRLQIETDAEGGENAASDQVGNRIVPEEREVGRPAARGDPGSDRDAQAANRFPGERVKVRPGRRAEGGKPGLRVR